MGNTKVVLRIDLILDSIRISSVCKSCAFKIIPFYIAYFKVFYPKTNEANMHNNIIDISSFQIGLTNLFSSTGCYFKSKVMEGSHKEKNMIFNFWALLVKIYIFEVLTFFGGSTYLKDSFF